MTKRIKIIPIFVPHQGCVNDCVFCNQKKITGLSTSMTKEQAEFIINRNLSTMDEDCEVQIAFYGGSFTAIDLQVQKELLGVAKKFKDCGKIQKIKLSTRPDYINDNILNVLKDNKVDIIELGVQSLDEEVLVLNNRGHEVKHVREAVELIKKYGFTLGLQMMIGLAGDNEEKSINTAKEFIKMKPQLVRIYPTLVLKETVLAQMLNDGVYIPFELQRAVELSAKLLMMFQYNDINVIRVGLQPTDNITLGNDVLAGPFHPAFRQLTQSAIYKLIIDMTIRDMNINESDDVKVMINKKHVSDFVGNKKSNINYIKDKYGVKNIKVFEKELDENLIHIQHKDNLKVIDVKKCIGEYLRENNLNE